MACGRRAGFNIQIIAIRGFVTENETNRYILESDRICKQRNETPDGQTPSIGICVFFLHIIVDKKPHTNRALQTPHYAVSSLSAGGGQM